MKIYAIRDRLIDYYMAPFTAPDDNEAKAGVAFTINNEETRSAINQAPHHFELWRLGEIHKEGHLKPAREFLADCSSLVRTGVRSGRTGTAGGGTNGGRQAEAGGPGADSGPAPGPHQGQAPGQAESAP